MTRQQRSTLIMGNLLLLMLCLTGCAVKNRQATLVLFLFDETSSFVETGNWDESLRMARVTVDHLAPGDAVGIIGIDHHGFDSDDVRLPVSTLSRATMQAVSDRKALKALISTLQPRKTSSGYRLPNGKTPGTPTGTDTLGAIDHAAQLASYYPQMRMRLILFSDMQNEPISGPSGYSGDEHLFKGNCQAKVLFVGEAGGREWKARVSRWCKALRKAGLHCELNDFYSPGMSSPSAIAADLPKWLK